MQADQAQAEYEKAIPVEAKAVQDEAAKTAAVSEAEEALERAHEAIEESKTSLGSAVEEKKGVLQRVRDAEAMVETARGKVRRLGGTGAGTNEVNPPPAPTEESGAGAEALAAAGDGAAALEKLSTRELDEVRKMTRPPAVVRRALELVQTLLRIAEGKELKTSAEEVAWEELQAMIAQSGFVKRVIALKPLALSMRPELLQQTSERWPGLLEAVGKSAAPKGPAGWKNLKKAAGKGSLKDRLAAAGAAAGASGEAVAAEKPAAEKPAAAPAAESPPADGGAAAEGGAAAVGGDAAAAPAEKPAAAAAAADANRRASNSTPGAGLAKTGASSKLAMAIAAAAAEAKPETPALTVEAVEYASRPCGAIFRYIATVMYRAVNIGAERAAAQAELDKWLKQLEGTRSALSATDAFNAKLTEEEGSLGANAKACAAAVDAAREAQREAVRELIHAQEDLEEKKRAAAAAALKAKQAGEVERRRKDDADRRQRDKVESQKLAQEAINQDLASRPPPPPMGKRLAWLYEHKLPMIKPLEFAVSASVLPTDAPISLARLAKELQSAPALKLHIAGHVASDEDPKLSSQRAQAVGAALIALGAVPSRLRAKGYGATISLSSTMRQRLKLKSERRVGIHAISEVRASAMHISHAHQPCTSAMHISRLGQRCPMAALCALCSVHHSCITCAPSTPCAY